MIAPADKVTFLEWVLGGKHSVSWIRSWNPKLVGSYGTVFCIGWMIREWFLVWIMKKEIE